MRRSGTARSSHARRYQRPARQYASHAPPRPPRRSARMSSITARSMRMGRMSCRRVPNDEPNPRQRHHGAAHTEPSTVPSRPVSELCRSVPRSTDKAAARPHCSRRRAGSPQRLYGHGIVPDCRRPHVPHRGYEAVITLSNDGPPTASTGCSRSRRPRSGRATPCAGSSASTSSDARETPGIARDAEAALGSGRV